ncbi:tRNA lysidine(34) synthetase TilS [Marimonas arenosa]|uniref:tRNA(Ile)-lysidine synthase n=1 Tax=Marimonas arenosa TaxID=1795305 RepID=A0AAE4B6A8_9RHOB|nr:tRNA lysidine(34) synthetase TilS [Marimonas arenosa]MDQ2090171.1 tRNA lysidine(34) synthetase TilS [Marimonas arenosa]
MTADAETAFEKLTGFLATSPPGRLGVAVSGGGDSVALLLLLSDWARADGTELAIATVDHGLRPEAAQEADFVAGLAARLGHDHVTLRWEGWDGTGNLQDSARRARYGLLASWAREAQLDAVALAHTRDDQAETVVMQLRRAAGVDGLAAMPARWWQEGCGFIRPLLGVGRDELRNYLRDRGQAWIEDPSNADRGFERVRTRDALAVLDGLGITAKVLAQVAAHMAKAREALDWHAYLEARVVTRVDRGDVVIDRKGWRALNDEIARRIIRAALLWVGRAPYPPRRAKQEQLIEAVKQGTTVTLAGCLVRIEPEAIRICREAAAVTELRAPLGELWDGRWRVIGPVEEGAELRALGEDGLRQCLDWRESGLPSSSLVATPAVWRGGILLAAPLAGFGPGWKAELEGGAEGFFATILPRGN